MYGLAFHNHCFILAILRRRLQQQVKFTITPYDVKPLRTIQNQPRTRRARGKTAILTESSYREDLATKQKTQSAKKTVLRKRLIRSNSSEARQTKFVDDDDDYQPPIITTDKDVACSYCGEFYSESTEGWIRCNECQDWAHNSCAGADDVPCSFVCDYCAAS